MFGAMIPRAERWRSIKVSNFERRQMATVRKQLDKEYKAENGIAALNSLDATPARKTSNKRSVPFRLV